MFEALTSALAAWRSIAHIAEWSGLSLGVLAAGAALVAFVPLSRKFVIAGAVLVVVGYVGVIHGDRVGSADVHAQWDDARKAAIEAERDRDAMVEHNLETKYGPQLAALQKQATERKSRSDQYERQILALRASQPAGKAAPAAACELGPRADRVRRQ
jgi:hypothetical protein